MDSNELIELFYNRAYEKFVNKQILDDKNYIVPRQQLTNYVHELVNIPYIDFINYIKQNGIEENIEVSDVTQFSSFSACEIEMCNALIWANNPGCQYIEIGRFFPNNINRSDSSYRRYGESHIKAATQLGLTFEYYNYWYLSCLGYIYPDLDDDVRKQFLARTITRNRLYQQMLIDILDHDVNPERYIDILPEYVMRRSLRCVCAYLDICLDECKETKINTYNLIKNYEVNKPFSAIQIPYGINKNLRTYLNKFDYRTLSKETTVDLIERYRKGDHIAYELLVKGHMRLVVNIAKANNHKGVELDDLIQEGIIGLIRALDHFNKNVHVGFNNYASWWIMQSITQALVTLPQIVHIPLNVITLHKKVWSFVECFEQKQGYLPSINQIDIDGNPDLEWIDYVYQLPADLKEITYLINDFDENESTLYQSDDFQEKEYKMYYVDRLLNQLDNKDSIILKKRYGFFDNQDGENLNAIAVFFGLTRERVRQIINKSICQLRDFFKIMKEETQKSEEVLAIDSVNEIISNHIPNGMKLLESLPTVVLASERKHLKHNNKTVDKSDIQYEVNILDGVVVGERLVYDHKDCTIVKILVRGNSSRFLIKYTNEILDYVPNDKSRYRLVRSQKKPRCHTTGNLRTDNVIKEQTIREALVGDRIVYDSKCCTVIKKKKLRGSLFLVVKYEDGTIDYLHNEKNRYRVI